MLLPVILGFEDDRHDSLFRYRRTGAFRAEKRGKVLPELCPDGPRYKALGNSWGVNCGEYIFDRMRMVEGFNLA